MVVAGPGHLWRRHSPRARRAERAESERLQGDGPGPEARSQHPRLPDHPALHEALGQEAGRLLQCTPLLEKLSVSSL